MKDTTTNRYEEDPADNYYSLAYVFQVVLLLEGHNGGLLMVTKRIAQVNVSPGPQQLP